MGRPAQKAQILKFVSFAALYRTARSGVHPIGVKNHISPISKDPRKSKGC
jgi:hypothetical protein